MALVRFVVPRTPPDAPVVAIRPTLPADLPRLYEIQLDPAANAMAGTKPRTREVFMAAWERNFADPDVAARTVLVGGGGKGKGGGEIAGGVSRFRSTEGLAMGYWIDRAHWGRGVASRAVTLFLADVGTRPLHASAAADNTASRRILERHGFELLAVRHEPETDRFLAREVAFYLLRGREEG